MIAALNQYLAIALILTTAALWFWVMLDLPDESEQNDDVIQDNERHGSDIWKWGRYFIRKYNTVKMQLWTTNGSPHDKTKY